MDIKSAQAGWSNDAIQIIKVAQDHLPLDATTEDILDRADKYLEFLSYGNKVKKSKASEPS